MIGAKRVRADVLLVERGLAESREQAQRLISAGRARVGTRVLVKPSTPLPSDAPIELLAPERYVSRGGYKLEAALETFAIDVRGLRCLDIGAGTGGFTDCLLQRGAREVVAVDVGRGQLHARLRSDPRVVVLEGVNARELPDVGPIDFVTADVSFISLRLVLPAVARRVCGGTPCVVLFKPQFEAGRDRVPRGGVIRDEALRQSLIEEFAAWAASAGWEVLGRTPSPVPGADGNREELFWLRTPRAEARSC
ncbi:16S/23S rRNA (cytidine-2'-O)-methyltransferase TlyA [bacterium HR29]|nr:16S/23S rRNA (cytidine-2'-O)-methyltransferase TlyA [bacterium HR29]